MKLSLLIASTLAVTDAFTSPNPRYARAASLPSRDLAHPKSHVELMMATDNEGENERPTMGFPSVPALTAAMWAITSTAAMADSPDWGIFEGRTGSLLHPITMISLLALSVSTAFLGFDWRRQRTIGDEISALKKSLPDLGGASSVSEALAAAESAESKDTALITRLRNAASVEANIKALQTERKELSEKGPRDKHFSQGALLAFLGTCAAIEGPLNTYARTGKLFPGPHLYVGAGLVCLWALAYACVPSMQKGNDTARSIHIGANLTGIGFFLWQVQSGIPILLKVLEKTNWP